jgi:hypothetical protein
MCIQKGHEKPHDLSEFFKESDPDVSSVHSLIHNAMMAA